MVENEKIMNSLSKMQNDIDSIKQEIESQANSQNSNLNNFKTIIESHVKSTEKSKSGSSRLEGDIETI